MLNLTHIPTAAEMATDRSTVIGWLAVDRSQFEDEAGYADACSDAYADACACAAQMLCDHGVDTTAVEIQIGEFVPGEIRAVWP